MTSPTDDGPGPTRGGRSHPEWERLFDSEGVVEAEHLAEAPVHGVEPCQGAWRPRPGDEIVEPLFGALIEEHARIEVVEEVDASGARRGRIALVWERVRLWWRR